jgi:hypothetical protein
MKTLIIIMLVGLALAGFGYAAAATDLIEPSRTLSDGAPAMGLLTVVSEPPGLEIVLNDTPIGATPLFRHPTPAGTHTLRVAGTETIIAVEPGRTLRISRFKEKFIALPLTQPAPGRRLAPLPDRPLSRPPAPAPAEQPRGLTSWDRYLNGTSPVF